MKLAELVVNLTAETASFRTEMRRSREEVTAFHESAKRAGEFLKDAFGGYLTFEAVKRGLTAVVEATEADERATARLLSVLKATGSQAGLTARELDEMARAGAGSTLFDANEIKDAESALMTFSRVQGDTFRRAIGLAEDLSTVFGEDLRTAATTLGKALQDPVRGLTALQRIGVTFSETQKAQIQHFVETGRAAAAQRVILDEVASALGGAAAGQHTGIAGAAHDVKSAWDDMLVSIGRTVEQWPTLQSVLHGIASELEPHGEQSLDPAKAMEATVNRLQHQADDYIARLRAMHQQAGLTGDALAQATQASIDRVRAGISTEGLSAHDAAALRDTIAALYTAEDALREYTRQQAAARKAADDAAASSRRQADADTAAAHARRVLADAEKALLEIMAKDFGHDPHLDARVKEITDAHKGLVDLATAVAEGAQRELEGIYAAQRAQDAAHASADHYTASLEHQVAAFHAGGEAALARAEAFAKMTPAERLHAMALEQEIRDYQKMQSQVSLATALQQHAAELTAEGWKEAARGTEQAFAQFFEAIGTKGMKDWQGILAGMLRAWQQTIAQMLAASATAGVFGFVATLFGHGAGAGAGSAPAPAPVHPAPVPHGGGTIGIDSFRQRSVGMDLFRGAPRYHTGFLAPDEVPAILQRGESVLTPGQMRQLGRMIRGAGAGATGGLTVHFAIQPTIYAMDGASVARVVNENEHLFAAPVLRAMKQSYQIRRAVRGRA